MRHSPDRHGTSHHIHRRLAYKTATQHQCLSAILDQTLSDSQTLIDFHTPLEAITHIHLHQDGHILACRLHDLIHHHIHKTHAILQRATKLILTMVGIRRKELADQVTMSGMDLHGIKSRLTSQTH